MNTKLTKDQVSQAVRDFWRAFGSGSPQSLADFYAPDATLFGVEGPRPEPGRLALLRRQREYFDRHARLSVEPGLVEVHLLNDTTALAVYTFTFHASDVIAATGKTQERHIANGRASQIFQLGPDGRPLIVHEHLSSADIRKD
jgi:ketosteroid isomerase-like protein